MKITGELIMYEQEGGYAVPAIRIRTEDGNEIALEEALKMVVPESSNESGPTGVMVEVTILRKCDGIIPPCPPSPPQPPPGKKSG